MEVFYLQFSRGHIAASRLVSDGVLDVCLSMHASENGNYYPCNN